jgi:hypothetical protein
LGLLDLAREALNLHSADAKFFRDSFTSTLCGYLRSNPSFVKDVKQDRRRNSVTGGSMEAANEEKNRLKNIFRRRGSTPRIEEFFMWRSSPNLNCRV